LLENVLLFAFVFFLPTQLGKHFFFPFAYIFGVRVDYLAPALYLTDILALAVIAWGWRSLKPFASRTGLLLLGGVVLNVALSRSPFISLVTAMRLAECAGVFLVMRSVFAEHKKIVFAALAVGTVLQVILVVLQFIHKSSLQGAWYYLGERALSLSTPGVAKVAFSGTELLRPYGTFSHPNSMGGFFFLVAVIFLTNESVTNIIMKYAVVALASFLVLFSFSKATLAALLVVLTLHYLRGIKSCRICTIAKIIPLAVLALVFFQGKTDPTSLAKRLDLIESSFHIFLAHPLSGTGLGAYLTEQALFPMHYTYFFLQPVHNILLLWIAETGIIGLAPLVFIANKIRPFISRPQVYLPLLAVFLTGMVDHYWLTLQQDRLLLALALGIVLADASGIMNTGHEKTARANNKK